MHYNSTGSMLAVGSHDNNIYIYNATINYQLHTKLQAHSSFITSFDWSYDGQYIRSVCGAYELLYFNTKTGAQLKDGPTLTLATEWMDHSCKLGWAVEGIYPPGTDGSHINTVAECKLLDLIATGDDYGLVSIYRDPVRDNYHKARSYRGHSEHVTKVAFAQEGDFMLSVGGMDQTVIQWKKVES